MKYRITVERLVEPAVRDPVGQLMSYEQWSMAFYQSFDNDKLDKVTAAIADAVNKVQNG